jgi:hypothetical protein
METALQPSSQNLRNKIAAIEAIELASLGFIVWCFGVFSAMKEHQASLFDQIDFLFGLELILLGSWVIYNAYIRVARAGGRLVDLGIWVIASFVTVSYTFWAWTILDLNRFFIARQFYRGEAPIEYAWSQRSKRIRKAWEDAQKTDLT